MKKLLSILAVSMLLTTGVAYAADSAEALSPLTVEQATQLLHDGKTVYSCPMKMTWFSDKPGQCPCCTLSLEKVKDIKDGQAVLEESQSGMQMDMKEIGRAHV